MDRTLVGTAVLFAGEPAGICFAGFFASIKHVLFYGDFVYCFVNTRDGVPFSEKRRKKKSI